MESQVNKSQAIDIERF